MTESTVGKRGFEPSKITIYVKNSGIVLEESSMALVNRDTGLIIAMGNEAEEAMDAPPTPAVLLPGRGENGVSQQSAFGNCRNLSGGTVLRVRGNYVEWEGKGTFLHKRELSA